MTVGVDGIGNVSHNPAEAAGETSSVTIGAAQYWQVMDVGELWQQRYLVWMLLTRDVYGRYRQTMFGPLWFVVGPLVRVTMISVVFDAVAGLPSEGVPYPLFAYSGLLVWELFAGGTQRSAASLVEYMPIVTKVYFPRVIVPLTAVLGGLADFAISLVILVAMCWYYGYGLTTKALMAPVFVILALTLALATGLFVSVAAVKYRDVLQTVGYVLQVWFYATPIAYSSDVVMARLPEYAYQLVRINPMTALVDGFRWALLGTAHPSWMVVAVTGFLAVTLVVVGASRYRYVTAAAVDTL